MKMPFGKHKGKPLREVPKDYLRWLQAECKLSASMREAIEQVLNPTPGRFIGSVYYPKWLE
jgi:uncharacterized protein (DUF3820 family)